MDSGLEYLFELSDNELQKKIMEVIISKGVNEESINELISYVEGGVE